MKEYPEDFPWREFIKTCIPFVVVLVVYFCVMAAISAESIAWLACELATYNVKN